MQNRSKSLANLLVDIILKLNESSEAVYNKLYPLLQETSHSFGFKIFSDMSYNLILEIDKIHGNENLQYLFFEELKEPSRKDIFRTFNNDKDYTRDYLSIIIDLVKALYVEDIKIGQIFAMFLTDLQEDTSKHSFVYIDKLIKYIEEELDLNIYSDINEFDTTDKSLAYLGIFYNYFFDGVFEVELFFKEIDSLEK